MRVREEKVKEKKKDRDVPMIALARVQEACPLERTGANPMRADCRSRPSLGEKPPKPRLGVGSACMRKPCIA